MIRTCGWGRPASLVSAAGEPVGIRGDFNKLRTLSKRFAKLKGPAFARGLTTQLAEEARDLVVKSLDTSIDPYGKPYAPLKHRRGRPLEKTGLLRNSITYTASSSGFRLFTNVFYAKWHNSGLFSVRIKASGSFKGGLAKTDAVPAKYRGRSAGKYGRKHVFHVRLPQRMFIPIGRSLPDAWLRAMIAVGNAFIRRAMK